MIIVKVVLIVAFLVVSIQDIKDRQVYWFLFPCIAACAGYLLYQQSFTPIFLSILSINLMFIFILIGIVYLYARLKLQMQLSDVFGLGDGLLFAALAFTFSSISFIVLFVFGLVFSLVCHLYFKRRSKPKSVPLAGYLSTFFAISYCCHWLGILDNLYTI